MNKYISYDKANNIYYVNSNRYIEEIYKNIMPQNVIEDVQKDISNIIEYKQIELALLSKCDNTSNSLCSVPLGSINSDIMVVNKSPNEFDIAASSSMLSPDEYLIPYLIKYMQLNCYCTNILKCNGCNTPEKCIDKYFSKELEIVKPKVIVFNGLDSYNMVKHLQLFNTMPSNAYYGNIYKAQNDTNVIIVYDTDKIFNNNDDNNSINRKNELWNQLLKIKNLVEVRK